MCQEEEDKLRGLLREALNHITEKPWDDASFLHKRISEALQLPIKYPEWDYSSPIFPEEESHD